MTRRERSDDAQEDSLTTRWRGSIFNHQKGVSFRPLTTGTPASRSAATAAADLAERTGSLAHFVTVIPDRERGRRGEATARRALRDCTAALGASRRRLASEEFRIGETATEIAQVADEVGAGLIVLGTSHRTGLAKVLLGTTLGSLLERALSPLLIIPADATAWPSCQVVIGDDATVESRLAGDIASEIGALYGAEITILEAMALHRQTEHSAATWTGQVRGLFEDRLQDRADEMERASGSRPALRLVAGAAVPALLDMLTGERGSRTLVALGTHRRTGLEGMFHSSVALAVVGSATGAALISPVGARGIGSAQAAQSIVAR